MIDNEKIPNIDYSNPTTKATDRRNIIKAIAEAGGRGLTSDEYSAKAGRPRDSFSNRFSEVRKGGATIRLRDENNKLVRRETRQGGFAIVHVTNPNPEHVDENPKADRKELISLLRSLLHLAESGQGQNWEEIYLSQIQDILEHEGRK